MMFSWFGPIEKTLGASFYCKCTLKLDKIHCWVGRGRKNTFFGYSYSQIIFRLLFRGLSQAYTLRHLSALFSKTYWPSQNVCTIFNVSLHVLSERPDNNDREKTYIFLTFSELAYPPSVIHDVHRRARMKLFSPQVQPDPNDYRPTVQLPFNSLTKLYIETILKVQKIRTADSSSHKISSLLVRRWLPVGNLNCGD